MSHPVSDGITKNRTITNEIKAGEFVSDTPGGLRLVASYDVTRQPRLLEKMALHVVY